MSSSSGPADLATQLSDDPAGGPPREAFWLTVLQHPDPQRVGERCALRELSAALPVELHRSAPAFGPQRRPLAHPRISRRATWLTVAREAVRVRPAGAPARLDGQPLQAERRVPFAQLRDEGVFIELGGCALLWLHLGSETPSARPLGLDGVSPALGALRQRAGRLALTSLPLLIRGEPGVGKERLARALHANSPRRDGPWVALDAATLEPEQAQALLFGGRGAPPGALERADGGTLLLDGVEALAPALQPMLLRALSVARNTVMRMIRADPELRLANELGLLEVREAMRQAGRDVEEAAAILKVSPHGLKLHLRALLD